MLPVGGPIKRPNHRLYLSIYLSIYEYARWVAKIHAICVHATGTVNTAKVLDDGVDPAEHFRSSLYVVHTDMTKGGEVSLCPKHHCRERQLSPKLC